MKNSSEESGGQDSQISRSESETPSAQSSAARTRSEMKSSEPGIGQTEIDTSPQSPTAEIAVSPTENLTGQLLSSEEAKLASLSLVDDVTQRLHLQMKRLTLRAEGQDGVDPIGSSHSERQRVGLALKTSSEIARMIRLKLDAVKIFKKLDTK